MSQGMEKSTVAAPKASLGRRIRNFYQHFNQGDWERCYQYVDPRLRTAGKVSEAHYVESLAAFKKRYGAIQIWYVRTSLHLDPSGNKHDDRPFAYAYVFWQDDHKGFHVFRERWVQASGRWYTRVAGLVASA